MNLPTRLDNGQTGLGRKDRRAFPPDRKTPDDPARHVVITVNAAWNILNFRSPLVSGLLADGYRVTVLAPRDRFVPQLEKLGCTFVDLPKDKGRMNPLSDLRFAWRIYRKLSELQPDIVLGFTIKHNIYGAMAARALGVPFVPNVTGLGTAFLTLGAVRKIAEGLYRTAFSNLAVAVFQNGDDEKLFRERGLIGKSTRSVFVPGSGVDLRKFIPAPYPRAGRKPVFLMVARLLKEKGVFEFIEAVRTLKARMPEARFHLLGEAGDTNPSAIPLELVQEWEREGLLEYHGWTQDVRPHLAGADCIVLPSWREGAPRTLIEGAATARPLIATDVPGCREVVEDGVNGLLCEARNADSLADAMARFLLLSRDERIAMGQAGRALAEEKFAAARVVDTYRAIVEDLVPTST